MNYTFTDGTVVDLKKVVEISEIRDYGLDENTIDKSTLLFTIRYKDGTSTQIKRYYHYSDWSVIVRELRSQRADLIHKWEEQKQNNA
jgi:hypothetical protein